MRLAAVSIAMLVGGCAISTTTPDAATADAGPPSMSRTYVVSTMRWSIDTSASPARAPGLDLDGRDGGDPSLPCTGAADFASEVDGTSGVDNQVGRVVAMEAGTPMLLQTGDYELVIEVHGIDDFVDDPTIDARVTVAVVAGGGAPAFDHDGSLVDGQTFEMRHLAGAATGRIRDHRLELSLDELPLGAAPAQVIAIHGVRLTAQITSNALTAGEIGGAMRVQDLYDVAHCNGQDALQLSDTEALYQPDMDPVLPDGTTCASASAGFGFDAVSATLLDRYAAFADCVPGPLPAAIADAVCDAAQPRSSPAAILGEGIPGEPAEWMVVMEYGSGGQQISGSCAIQDAVARGATFCEIFEVGGGFAVVATPDVIDALTQRSDVRLAEINGPTCI